MQNISESGAMLILIAAGLIMLLVLWLVFRKARLWYWKTDIQVDTLKRIDIRLHNVEEKLSFASSIEKLQEDIPEQINNVQAQESEQEIEMPESSGLTFVGKSGRVYKEAELELQIRY